MAKTGNILHHGLCRHLLRFILDILLDEMSSLRALQFPPYCLLKTLITVELLRNIRHKIGSADRRSTIFVFSLTRSIYRLLRLCLTKIILVHPGKF